MRREENGRGAVKISQPGSELGSEQESRMEMKKCGFLILSRFLHVTNVRTGRAKYHKILGLERCLKIIESTPLFKESDVQ